MKDNYWFLESSEELADKLAAHHSGWQESGTNLMAQNWLRNSIAYYSTIMEPNDWQSALGFAGEQGELVRMVVPQARSFIRKIVTLATKQRLFFRAIAENTDSDVLQDTRIGNSLIEQVVVDQHMDRKREYNVEAACVYGMSFYKVTWRSDRGTPYVGRIENNVDEDGNEFETPVVHYDGDLEIATPSVNDVYWDTRIVDWNDVNWAECRTTKNRWDMIASFPDLKDDIMKIDRIDSDAVAVGNQSGCNNEDLIYVYECFHKPSPALPKGRMIVYSDKKTIYYDDINPYECIPIVPLKPEPILGMGYGYPKLNDLLPAQEMFDMCLSTAATNNAALGTQSVLCPREADISVNQIGGVNWIYYNPSAGEGGGAPKPLQLTQSAPETYKLADIVKQNMMEMSGLNAALQGTPPPGVSSGKAIATLTANALEFMNSLSKADQMALEEVAFLAVLCYSKFATIPRLVSMTGRGQMFAKEFTGANLASIKKVRFITSNPMMNTIGGRIEIADKMLESGMVKNIQEYFRILEGAPTEVMFSEEVSQEDLIQRENEALLDGRPVIAIKTDDHAGHIKSHSSLLNDPMVRMNGAEVAKILAHMDEHEQLAQTMSPFLAAMIATGKMPAMPPPLQGGQPPQAGPGGPPPGVAMPEEMKPATPSQDPLKRMR